MASRLIRLLRAAAIAAATVGGLAAPLAASADEAKEQFIPLATFRVGPYASSGIPVWAGLIDTLRYINEAQGGINGVKLFWE
ncbi:MAG: ABC transporter substrate-binding protein, partial [Rhodospirillales bacterium]|nr:ABC transporter substrate-binding protein [Rhodospirillales bacterium]